MGEKSYSLGSPEWENALLYNPAVRPDGLSVELRRLGDAGGLNVSVGGRGWVYSQEELTTLGEGDPSVGIERVGLAVYELELEPNRMYKPFYRTLYPQPKAAIEDSRPALES